jgi:uncharacterized membrane protein YqhA
MTSGTPNVLTFLLGLRAIILIGSVGAMAGALLMFLQGSSFLYHAWHDFFSGQQVVPVLKAVDAFLFGIVLVIFAYGIAIGFVFSLPVGYGQRLPNWMKVEGVGQLKATLAEVVIVVLVVIFARVVVGTVELSRPFEWPMLVLSGLDLSHRHRASHDRARRRERIAEYRRG